jgi:hypothetical protein
MRYSSFQARFLRLLGGSAAGSSRIIIAAALGSAFFAFTPAFAGEEGDGSLFRVPGEGPPYVPSYSARADWPPMPDRSPYSIGRLDYGNEHDAHHFPHRIDKDREVPDSYFPKHRRYERLLTKHHRDYEDRPEPRVPYREKAEDYAERSVPYREKTEDFAERRVPYREKAEDLVERRIPYVEKAESLYDDDFEGPPFAQYVPSADGSRGEGYGRLFPKVKSHDDTRALIALGRAMVEQGEPGDPSGNSRTPAGYTYLGQFIDHDIALDTKTQLGREIRGDFQLINARTPDLDLDNVYGEGPDRSPHLFSLPYIRVGRLLSGDGYAPRADLFRTKSARVYGPAGGEAVALIGDLRDDENIIISQLHAAFVAFHNRTVDILVERDFGQDRGRFCKSGSHCDTQELAAALPDGAKLKIYGIAHDHVVHYYHRIIAEDFLPRIIGRDYTAAFLTKGRAFFFPNGFGGNGPYSKLYIPVEFAAAVYRFGHSQVRDEYQIRRGAVFDLLSEDGRGPHAFQPVTPRFLIDWRYFFDIGHERPDHFNYARKIDTELVRSLNRLNFSNAVGKQDLGSLAARDLVRGKTLQLPSGQSVAERILPVLQQRGLIGQGGYGPRAGGYEEGWRAYILPPSDRARYYLGDAESPLWYYVLQEASVFGTYNAPYSEPTDGDDDEVSGEYGPRRHRDSWQNASVKYRDGRPYARGYDNADGGFKLGPVGATIVGEVLTGLLEHYRETTGKGLAYQPEIRGSVSKGRYTMGNFLVDAGVADAYVGGEDR